MSASIKSVLRIAAYPFDQERYIFFASAFILAGLATIAGFDDARIGGPLLGAGLGWHVIMITRERKKASLLVGRSRPDGSPKPTEAKP